MAFDGSTGKSVATAVKVPPLRTATAVEVIVRGPLTVAFPTVLLFGVTVVCTVVVVVSGV